MKTVEAINEKIRAGTAIVMTAAELKEHVRAGERLTLRDVDVVTTGTFGVMSGTCALLSLPVAAPGVFERAEQVWLNGVPGLPGPCPNERLGIVDLLISGTARRDERYGGGHLFRDLVEGKEIDVEVEAEGKRHCATVTLGECGFARILTTRSAFRNYIGVVNPHPGCVRTIFSVTAIAGPCREASVSGCGDINPIENDPSLATIGVGTRILMNGGVGYLTGCGTRSSRERPNVMASADMQGMLPDMMGGFVTSAGPECLTSFAIPIPVLDEAGLQRLQVRNAAIPLPIAGITDRRILDTATYADVWDTADRVVRYAPELCIRCETCRAEELCPTGAMVRERGIDRTRCVNCGTCISACVGASFSGALGSVSVRGTAVPITLRQSDRVRAERLCELLKARITGKDFFLSCRSGTIR